MEYNLKVKDWVPVKGLMDYVERNEGFVDPVMEVKLSRRFFTLSVYNAIVSVSGLISLGKLAFESLETLVK